MKVKLTSKGDTLLAVHKETKRKSYLIAIREEHVETNWYWVFFSSKTILIEKSYTQNYGQFAIHAFKK